MLKLIRFIRSWLYVRKYGFSVYSEQAARRIFWYNNRLARKSFANRWIDVFYNVLRLESPLEEFNDD